MPPRILQIHRDTLKPDADAAYGQIEEEVARICRDLGCPHTSPAEQQQVADDYKGNPALMAALERAVAGKGGLTMPPVNLFASHRPDVSGGTPWTMGGRLLVIIETKRAPGTEGTVFETEDGTRFIIDPARTRKEADAKAAAAGPQARIFAVRTRWSWPAKEWTAADPEFWRT